MKLHACAVAFMLALLVAPAWAQGAEPAGVAPPKSDPAAPAQPPRRVTFNMLGSDQLLEGFLFMPPGDQKPSPAVVMMHGCSGLINPRTGTFFPLYPPWAKALTRAGYVVLIVNSAGPRELGQTCTEPNAGRMWRERPQDAYAALRYLQAEPFVKKDRVAVIGWSQGGGAVLLAINERTAARTSTLSQAMLAGMPADFRAAVAFYPGACRDDFHRMTYPPGERVGWTSKVPLLVLFGDADVWTKLGPCREFLEAAKARGNDIALQVYPGAYHSFDAPNLKRTELPQYRTRKGEVPVLETDQPARADAFRRVLEFLDARLKS